MNNIIFLMEYKMLSGIKRDINTYLYIHYSGMHTSSYKKKYTAQQTEHTPKRGKTHILPINDHPKLHPLQIRQRSPHNIRTPHPPSPYTT